jgi:hypothetical protein
MLIKSDNIEDIWILIEEINDDRLADDGIPVAAQRDVVVTIPIRPFGVFGGFGEFGEFGGFSVTIVIHY